MDSINKKKDELKKIEAEIEEINEDESFDLEKTIEHTKKLKKCYELTKEIEQKMLTILTILKAEKYIKRIV